MTVIYPMGVLHSFSIKKIFYEKMDLRIFFHVGHIEYLFVFALLKKEMTARWVWS